MGQEQPLSWEMSDVDDDDGDDGDGDGDEKRDELAVLRLRKEAMAHLTSLRLWCLGEDNLTEAEFQSILAHCPNLTTILVPAVHWIQHPQQLAQEIAQQLCPKLTNVQMEYLGGNSGNSASWELAFRSLEALSAQQVQRFHYLGRSFLIPGLTSDDAGSMFRRQSATLRKIMLAGCQNFDSRAIRTILVECWALERLEVQFRPWEELGRQQQQQQQQQQPLCINLDDAIESPWGCTRIRNLDLTIAIPDEPFHRSNEMGVVPYYNRPSPTTLSPEETAQFQSLEAFYRQLGALTELERLKLKAIYYNPAGDRSKEAFLFKQNSFPGMLNLRKEVTGRPGYLHLLRGLTKLKELLGSVAATTEETKATIGMDEVVWMDKHWPALERAGFFMTMNAMISKPFQWLMTQRAVGEKSLQLA